MHQKCMNRKIRLPSPISRRALPGIILATVLLLRLVTPLLADDRYLALGHPDGVALLGPPPVPGSGEEAADLATVRLAFKGRTPEEELQAKKEDEKLSLSLFEPAIGPIFQSGKLPQTEALLKKMKKEMGEAVSVPKEHWKRLRPYQMDAELTFGRPEKSFSYPSGHSTWGTVHALVLAELFPEKRDAILAIGRNIGWDRVLVGKHFPTDVRAGRVLGQAIVREMLASPAFQHDLAAAKMEVQAAQNQPAGK
jgi:acid phosphatase (class A)